MHFSEQHFLQSVTSVVNTVVWPRRDTPHQLQQHIGALALCCAGHCHERDGRGRTLSPGKLLLFSLAISTRLHFLYDRIPTL